MSFELLVAVVVHPPALVVTLRRECLVYCNRCTDGGIRGCAIRQTADYRPTP